MFDLIELEDKNLGLVKSYKTTSYLFGMLGAETVIEFYPIAVKEGKHGRTKK